MEDFTTELDCTPWIYRPPEASSKMGPRLPLDDLKFDCWRFGILALEMFTSETYYNETASWSGLTENY